MKVGVVIGRFQVPIIHDGHEGLIGQVIDKSNEILILVGVAPVPYTKENPLDYETRRQMIEEYFESDVPGYPYQILPIADVPTNEVWSDTLDSLVGILYPGEEVTLYGSRDSFIPHYCGKYPTVYVADIGTASGTEIRKSLKNSPVSTPLQRKALIKGIMNQYPKVYATVDVVIYDKITDQFLLGRKKNETQYRFIGGFSDPTDKSFEAAAIREAYEESGLPIGDLKYIGSFHVADWRYRSLQDQIITTFFIGNYIYGQAKASDDIAEVKWFSKEQLYKLKVVSVHKPLLEVLISFVADGEHLNVS